MSYLDIIDCLINKYSRMIDRNENALKTDTDYGNPGRALIVEGIRMANEINSDLKRLKKIISLIESIDPGAKAV